MSEVNRYEINGTFEIPETGQKLVNPKMVMESDFDRVTAERDALQVRLNESDELCGSLERSMKNHRHELGLVQQRLTAADERADVLEGLLNLAQGHIGDASLSREIDAALKPAELAKDEHVCTGCGSKGWTANCKECVPY